MEQAIKDSLVELMDAIKQSDGERIAMGLKRLDDLREAGRDVLHPQLIHFLEGRSYAKAVAFLGGEGGIPVGSCRGKGAGR
ncbi:MAG TPA: hypothetical protein PLV87_01260 [Opitutaceae bacterium]|jgi:hypothetical protein|nr:hypothetical protein [Opitutaceae bacterium]